MAPLLTELLSGGGLTSTRGRNRGCLSSISAYPEEFKHGEGVKIKHEASVRLYSLLHTTEESMSIK